MPTHDIIDNREEKLVDHVLEFLPRSEQAKFAVGYFFLSGLEALGEGLEDLQELRLLIGNTSNRRTIEQLAEGYKRLELVEEAAERMRYAKRADRQQSKHETARNVREGVEIMDQTDRAQELVHSLLEMIRHKRLKVRVYTRGRLHAKAYIFDWENPNPGDDGIAVVGSSNLSLAGIQDNTELNVRVYDNGGNHARLTEWFEELWDEAEPFAPELMDELSESWAARLATPYEVFMKTAYTLVKDRLEGEGDDTVLWDDKITRDLADFQKQAVKTAVGMIREYDGCFVSDVVGLGKSYIASAIVKHFRRVEGARPLIICPKPLVEMWEGYNEQYELEARVLSMGMVQSGERGVDILNDQLYRDRDFVLIDESHNFRHHSTQRYEELAGFLGRGQRVCLVTATPRNTRAWDVYHQMKLFHQEDITLLPIDPPNLRTYFNMIENGEKKLENLLRHIIVRRRRRDIIRWYGYAEGTGEELRKMSDKEVQPYLSGEKRAYVRVGGRHQFFPQRELKTLRYNIEDTYHGLYDDIRGLLGKPGREGRQVEPGKALTYARYGLWHYVQEARQKEKPYSELQRAGINLRGLIRTMLFKRFESSVYAFRATVGRMISTHRLFAKSVEGGRIPAGEKAEQLLGRAGRLDDEDLLDALVDVPERYNVEGFCVDRLLEHIRADVELLERIEAMVQPITPDEDDKLQVLLRQLESHPVDGGKCLVFTQYADTAQYLYGVLDPEDRQDDIEVIYGTDKSKARVAGRFAPRANPEFAPREGQPETRLLVATDVLSQGLNLQDCDIAINYDLHWNPVRLIQRFGRIDRIGSTHDVVWGVNFLPEVGLEKQLGIESVLQARIQEIHDTIGEDAEILDKTERLNENAMYAIYEEDVGQLSLFDEDDEKRFIGLNEVEEILRSLREQDPAEYKRVTDLRDGIRSGKVSDEGETFVHCRAGNYQKLYLVDDEGQPVCEDPSEILGTIRAAPEEPAPAALPADYNQRVMKIRERFAAEVQQRRSEQQGSSDLLVAQRYVTRELQELFSRTDDDDKRRQLNLLEEAFRRSPSAPVKKRLNAIRRSGMTGEPLFNELVRIYHDYRLDQQEGRPREERDDEDFPRIVSSEALLY